MSLRLSDIRKSFHELCLVAGLDDGLIYESDSVSAERIREEQRYEGVRIKLTARLDSARIPVQVDIGFGDAVAPIMLEYPTVLPMPVPRVQAYPMEAVIAEKSEAIYTLGVLNSRMKDFFDICFLANAFAFDGKSLANALHGTFERRRTIFDYNAMANLLEVDLSKEPSKQTQWHAFVQKSALSAPAEFSAVLDILRSFLLPLFAPASRREQMAVSWLPGGPWRSTISQEK